MIAKTITVKNKIGLHARPASLLVTTAGKFKSDMTITKGKSTVALTSMINLLRLMVKMNDQVTISASGPDENEALTAVTELVDSKFGED